MWGPRVRIDADLLERVKRHARTAGYSSVEEFVHHVLERELAALESAESEEELKKRLKGLGYLG